MSKGIETVELKQFNINTMERDSCVLVVAKRRAGKSFLIRDILYHFRNIPAGIVMSGSEEASPYYSYFIPSIFIHDEFKSDELENVFIMQKKNLAKARKNGLGDDKGKCSDNNFFIILDDLLSDKGDWIKDKHIRRLFMNGRHYNLFSVIALQYILGIPPDLRNNIDYIFLFNEPNLKNRRKIYDEYCGMIPTFERFNNIFEQCTKNHECLVIKLTGNFNSYSDQIFYYKAKERKDFRVGSKQFWSFSNNNYNSNYKVENEELEEKFIQEKKNNNKLKIYVNKVGQINKVEN